MKRSDAFPSKWLKKEDVDPDRTFTIAKVTREEVGTEEEKELKTTMHFAESDAKPMVFNPTNWDIVEEMYGDDTDLWIGKKITLYNEPNVSYGGKRTGGIRVRGKSNGKAVVDYTQAFWAKAYEMDIAKADAQKILAQHNGDFEKALAGLELPA